MSKDVVRDAPAGDSVRTVTFTKDTVVMESETRLPPPLMVGYFRGLMFGFGKICHQREHRAQGHHGALHAEVPGGPRAGPTGPTSTERLSQPTPPRPSRATT